MNSNERGMLIGVRLHINGDPVETIIRQYQNGYYDVQNLRLLKFPEEISRTKNAFTENTLIKNKMNMLTHSIYATPIIIGRGCMYIYKDLLIDFLTFCNVDFFGGDILWSSGRWDWALKIIAAKHKEDDLCKRFNAM